jgi:predicted amidophosphoribosyltransferase
MTALYLERKTAAEPLCTRCGAPAADDHCLCRDCRELARERTRICMQRLRDQRRAARRVTEPPLIHTLAPESPLGEI